MPTAKTMEASVPDGGMDVPLTRMEVMRSRMSKGLGEAIQLYREDSVAFSLKLWCSCAASWLTLPHWAVRRRNFENTGGKRCAAAAGAD